MSVGKTEKNLRPSRDRVGSFRLIQGVQRSQTGIVVVLGLPEHNVNQNSYNLPQTSTTNLFGRTDNMFAYIDVLFFYFVNVSNDS